MNKTVKNAIITGIITFPIGIAIGYSYQGRKLDTVDNKAFWRGFNIRDNIAIAEKRKESNKE